MLNQEQLAIIKATVPLLETGGEALITHFYKMMLSEYPEVRPLFNQANQRSGNQPRALANAVLNYAKHIEELNKLGPLVSQIVNKHVALQIQPQHYPIVGTCLLRAIREVLGKEIATDAVIDAWAAAYQQLADILIGAEAKEYDTLAAAPGGWRGARQFTVAKKVKESDEIISFYFEPTDKKEVITYHPGQYIGLQLLINGEEVRRNYSLSSASNQHYLRISVKRENNGVVSNFLHDTIKVGDTINIFPPAGDFTLDNSQKPVVFITAGVGITPSIAMTQEALKQSRDITFIHCARHPKVDAFYEQIRQWEKEFPRFKAHFVYDAMDTNSNVKADATGHITQALLTEWIKQPTEAEIYFLGPKGFMAFIKQTLANMGVPEEHIHYEFFGPAQALVA